MLRPPTSPEHFHRLWAELHDRPRQWAGGDDAAWMAAFTARLPCGECRTEWVKLLAEMPPDISSPDAYFAWTVEAHNRVNIKLGKAQMTLEAARANNPAWTSKKC